jgi:single-stranded DNA-binding protein
MNTINNFLTDANHVFQEGHLVDEPAINHTPRGKIYCELSIETKSVYLSPNGQKIIRNNRHRLMCWNGLVEKVKKLNKGSYVAINGSLHSESFILENARKTQSVILIESLKLLSHKNSAVESKSFAQ